MTMVSSATCNTAVLSDAITALNNQPVTAVLFDLDGTLIDSVPDLAAAIDAMLQRMGKAAVGEVKVNRWVGNGAAALVKRALLDADDGDALHQARFNHELDDEEYATAYPIFECAYAERLTAATGLYDGVLSVLSQLQAANMILALITNKPRRFTLPLLEALNIAEYFGDVICGDDLAYKKPHPLPVLTSLKNLGVKAEQAIMVGDSISDIQSAQQANVTSVAVTYGYNHGRSIKDESNDARADVFIDNMQQLLSND